MAILSTLLPSLFTLAQAGGGGSFGGGGGGGGGGDGGGGDLLYYLIRFAIEVPVLGVPLLIFLSFCVFKMYREGSFKVKNRKIRRYRRSRHNLENAQSSKVLQQSDPDFDPVRFTNRVRVAFRRAQDSWCAQDLTPLSLFVSDGIYERFSLQIEEQVIEGWRQGMGGTKIRTATIADVEVGDQFDRLTVRISFYADIYRLSLGSNFRIPGSTLERKSFTEAWTFLRGHGTKSFNGDGLMEGCCPNCGADLVMRQSARCGHCDCHAKSGQFDWILAEITQWGEWSPESCESIPGLEPYQEVDPGWHPQVLEDIASVVFWRKVAADRRGGIELLVGHTTEAFLDRYSDRLEPTTPEKVRTYLTNCAVGSVRTIGILRGEERDRVVIELVYDGKRTTEDHDGDLNTSKHRLRRCSYFIFSRQSGAKTDRSMAFSAAHCRECGAHDDGSGEAECRYCGASRSGDPTLWLLDEIVTRGSKDGAKLFKELKTLRESESLDQDLKPRMVSSSSLVRWAVALVHADGEIDRSERAKVRALAEHIGMEKDAVDELLNKRPSEADYPLADDDETARAWIMELMHLAMEDGKVSKKEVRFLKRASLTLGIPPKEYDRILRSTQTQLYRRSRAAQRGTLDADSPLKRP